MFRQAVRASIVTVFIICAATAALAQAPAVVPPPAAIGAVESVTGQAIVVRGSQTFSLASGDQLFPLDRVLTRTNGGIVITNATCTKTLTSAQSIVVDEAICTKTPIALGPNEYNQAAAAGTGAGAGATPAVLGLLAVGGGTAAAVAGGDDSSSP